MSSIDNQNKKPKISRLLEQHSPVICGPIMMKEIGRAPAIFLQKLHYWLMTEGDHIGYFVDGRRWIYNTYEDWAENLGGIYCSVTIARAVRKLEKLGIISTKKFRNSEGDHQKAYAINYDVLNTLFPWLTQEMPDANISKNKGNLQDTSPQNVQIEKEQNVLFIHKDSETTSISSITSGEDFANSQVGKLAKPPIKEKINKPEKKTGVLTEANQTVYKLVEVYNSPYAESFIICNS